MDSIQSCDMLKRDTESFYKLIAENKTITQSHQVEERSKSIQNTDIFPWEILLLKTPLSLLYNEPRNHETIQCTLLTRLYCTILACLSCAIHVE